MDSCIHVETLQVAQDLSISDPSKWLCSVCGTTESVWVSLLQCSSYFYFFGCQITGINDIYIHVVLFASGLNPI